MVIEYIIHIMLEILRAPIEILPALPDTPASIVEATEWIIDAIRDSAGVLAALFTTPLLTATILIIVALNTWETFYHSTMWIIRKVPFVNIK